MKTQRRKRNKTNVTPEKNNTTYANQTPGVYKFAPLAASQLWQANQHEPAYFGLSTSWSFPSRSGHMTACCSPALGFSAAIHLAMKCSAPRAAVLRHSPSSWAPVVHWWSLMPKALRSSRKFPIHSLSWPPTQPATPTNFLSIAHFGSLVSSMRATNLANKIRLLREVASMLSLPVLIACPDRKSGGRRDCTFANQCSESRTRGGLGVVCRSGNRAGST